VHGGRVGGGAHIALGGQHGTTGPAPDDAAQHTPLHGGGGGGGQTAPDGQHLVTGAAAPGPVLPAAGAAQQAGAGPVPRQQVPVQHRATGVLAVPDWTGRHGGQMAAAAGEGQVGGQVAVEHGAGGQAPVAGQSGGGHVPVAGQSGGGQAPVAGQSGGAAAGEACPRAGTGEGTGAGTGADRDGAGSPVVGVA